MIGAVMRAKTISKALNEGEGLRSRTYFCFSYFYPRGHVPKITNEMQMVGVTVPISAGSQQINIVK